MNPEISRNHTRRTRKLRPRLRKFAAVLLAAMLPGAGHLFIGLFIRGMTFMLLLLLDISAMLYVSSEVMRINVPLLVLLGVFIPVLYFYNVYDVLQSSDYIILHKRKPQRVTIHSQPGQERSRYDAWETGILFSLLLVAGGALMILFRVRPRWLEYFFADYGFYLLAFLLVIIGLLLFLRELGVSVRKGSTSRKGGK
ncbi:hypothetical protein OIN60_15160 [Paenibacillus sp. P96]|uniref:Uncharacterized protein n=1 Tax=Paenibacillus zeirhizosphaerae TaxID=2987519 RepID=A0ABT9FTR1_9BACL|nr:hypothetical protein [Paenibacillus sp. P96]MDP4098098.1 hypothetical protein [Paenibacillus sp. P96]